MAQSFRLCPETSYKKTSDLRGRREWEQVYLVTLTCLDPGLGMVNVRAQPDPAVTTESPGPVDEGPRQAGAERLSGYAQSPRV